MSAKEVLVTPKAPAIYPFVTKPCTKFNAEGTYKITLLLDPSNAEHKSFLAHLGAELKKAEVALKMQAKNKPFRKHFRKDDKSDTGLWEVTFKSQYPPRVFDAVGTKINGDLNVGNESIVKVAYCIAPYSGLGGGVTLYFQALQILELVEYNGGAATDYGFGAEDGFNIESRFEGAVPPSDAVPEDVPDFGADAPSDAVFEDDLPF